MCRQLKQRMYEINVARRVYFDHHERWLQRVEYQKVEIDRQLKSRYPKIYDELEFEPKKN